MHRFGKFYRGWKGCRIVDVELTGTSLMVSFRVNMVKYILTKEEAESRSQIISNVSYQLLLSLTTHENFFGSLTVTLSVNSLSPIWLDFKGECVEALKINNEPHEVIYEDCRIYLPGLSLGINTIQLNFTGIYSTDGSGLHKSIDPINNEIYLFTQFEPFAANRAFPCFDQPDIKGTFELTVACHAEWKVISNTFASSVTLLLDEERGKYLVQEKEQPMKVHKFKPTLKISTYVYAIMAGPYTEFRVDWEIPLGFYCRKSMEKLLNPEVYAEWTRKAFEFFNSYFDFQYPFEKYDQIFVPEFNFIAMENVAAAVYDESFLFPAGVSQNKRIRACYAIFHEMSHMWFGNLVTMKWWDNLWLNESFATFIGCNGISKQFPDTLSEIWLFFCKQQRSGISEDQLLTTHPISCTVSNTIEIFSFFDGISYEKGSSVIKQLCFTIGEEPFKLALQKYFKTFQYSNASFEDLIGIIGEFATGINLQEWAEVWLKQAGLTELTPVIVRDENFEITDCRIVQKAMMSEHPTLRSHEILINVYGDEFELVKQQRVCVAANEETSIEITGKGYVLLNSENYTFCRIGFDEASLRFFLQDLCMINSDLSRMQIYCAVWDLVLDGKLSLREFLDFAKKNISSETQIYNFMFLTKSARKALLCSKNTQFLLEKSHEVFEVLEEKLNRSPESHVLNLKKLLIAILYNPDDIRKAVSWLENGSIELNQILRWKILEKFSTISEDAKDLVEKEHSNDKSLDGNLHYLYCEAAYPNAELKQKTLDIILSDAANMQKFQRIQIMRGYNNPLQIQFISNYSGYFEEVAHLARHDDLDYSLDFTQKMMPKYRDNADIISSIETVIKVMPEERGDLIRYLNQKKFILSKRKIVV